MLCETHILTKVCLVLWKTNSNKTMQEAKDFTVSPNRLHALWWFPPRMGPPGSTASSWQSIAAALLPSRFTHQHSYYTHHQKVICICWAELWSRRRAVTQPHSSKVWALWNGSEEPPWWILSLLCSIKSPSGAQKQVAERPLTASMAYCTINLRRHVWQECGISRSTPGYLG